MEIYACCKLKSFTKKESYVLKKCIKFWINEQRVNNNNNFQ